MNPVVVANFFHIICKGLFISLLAAGEVEGRLLETISNHIATVKTNRHGILHLHCLVWLKNTFQ